MVPSYSKILLSRKATDREFVVPYLGWASLNSLPPGTGDFRLRGFRARAVSTSLAVSEEILVSFFFSAYWYA